jgi:hypothetical protein
LSVVETLESNPPQDRSNNNVELIGREMTILKLTAKQKDVDGCQTERRLKQKTKNKSVVERIEAEEQQEQDAHAITTRLLERMPTTWLSRCL